MTKMPYCIPNLRVHAVDHCNLNCKGCGDFATIAQPRYLIPADWARDLRRLTEIMGVDELNIIGGEPLLNSNLEEIVRVSRVLLPESRIAVQTNGILLRHMRHGFYDTLRECDIGLLITPYPETEPAATLTPWLRSKGVDPAWATKGHVVKLFLSRIHPRRRNKDWTESSAAFAACGVGGRCTYLERGMLWICARSAFARIFNERFFTSMPEYNGYDLFRPEASALEISRFISRPNSSCDFCTSRPLWFWWGRSHGRIEEWDVDTMRLSVAAKLATWWLRRKCDPKRIQARDMFRY